MTKQLGSHVEKLLMDNMGKAFDEINETVRELSKLEREQNVLKEKLKVTFAGIDEIIELKGITEIGSVETIEFNFEDRKINYDVEEYEKSKQDLLGRLDYCGYKV